MLLSLCIKLRYNRLLRGLRQCVYSVKTAQDWLALQILIIIILIILVPTFMILPLILSVP